MDDLSNLHILIFFSLRLRFILCSSSLQSCLFLQEKNSVLQGSNSPTSLHSVKKHHITCYHHNHNPPVLTLISKLLSLRAELVGEWAGLDRPMSECLLSSANSTSDEETAEWMVAVI